MIKENKIKNKTFAITGTLSRKREEIIKLIEKHGGTVKNSMSSKVDYLIISDHKSSSSKAQYARNLGIPLLSEKKFNNFIPSLPIAYYCNKNHKWYTDKNFTKLATGHFNSYDDDTEIRTFKGYLHDWNTYSLINKNNKIYYLYGIPYNNYSDFKKIADNLKLCRNIKLGKIISNKYNNQEVFLTLLNVSGSKYHYIYTFISPKTMGHNNFPNNISNNTSLKLQYNIYIICILKQQMDCYKSDLISNY